MKFRIGMWVRNPNQPDWGSGEVLEQDGNKVRVLCSGVGEKSLVIRFATLEETELPVDTGGARPQLRARTHLDIADLSACVTSFTSSSRTEGQILMMAEWRLGC